MNTSAHLIVRKDGVLCTTCKTLLPVHPGDGTPLPSFLAALANLAKTHPVEPHYEHDPLDLKAAAKALVDMSLRCKDLDGWITRNQLNNSSAGKLLGFSRQKIRRWRKYAGPLPEDIEAALVKKWKST